MKRSFNISALCKESANGNVALGKSCNRYWSCQGGYPRLQRCPAGLVFDRKALRCVIPPTEDCAVPTTTTEAPSEEDQDQQNRGQQNNRNGQQQQGNRNNNNNQNRFQ